MTGVRRLHVSEPYIGCLVMHRGQDVKMTHKRSGIQRWLNGAFGVDVNSKPAKAIAVLLYPFVPKVVMAHMIMAIAQKPG